MKSTFHRDGTVTFWSVFSQVWTRLHVSEISDETLATMNDAFRARVARIVARS